MLLAALAPRAGGSAASLRPGARLERGGEERGWGGRGREGDHDWDRRSRRGKGTIRTTPLRSAPLLAMLPARLFSGRLLRAALLGQPLPRGAAGGGESARSPSTVRGKELCWGAGLEPQERLRPAVGGLGGLGAAVERDWGCPPGWAHGCSGTAKRCPAGFGTRGLRRDGIRPAGTSSACGGAKGQSEDNGRGGPQHLIPDLLLKFQGGLGFSPCTTAAIPPSLLHASIPPLSLHPSFHPSLSPSLLVHGLTKCLFS